MKIFYNNRFKSDFIDNSNKFKGIDKLQYKSKMTEMIAEEKQQCFIQETYQQIQNKYLQADINVDVVVNVYRQLPPNQLRNIGRPENLIPRTLSVNKLMALLPDFLNQNCLQASIKTVPGINRIKIANKQKITLQEFFSKKQFKEVYNRFSNFPADSKSFTGKILNLDSVVDYNHKLFRQLEQQQKPQEQKNCDSIDADFQSGNICRAYTPNSDQNQYFLMIENDINTYGYNIWFFFRLRNHKKGLRTFHLVNMIKKTDNFKKGMQISIFSVKKFKKEKTMWQKCGDKINFGQTNFPRTSHLSERYYYLSFQYEFQEDDDEVYFALNQPYTYSRMINHITSLQKRTLNSGLNVEIKRIGHTLADNVIPAVKIWTGSYQNKQTILITARQHPCETVSSFVCQGMINHLLSQEPQVKLLLQKYQILVIPMMNPDGVIHGSSRCNLAGFDLNRQWSQFLIKQFTPQTHRIKKYLTQFHKQNPIKHFIDIHGHGKKLNSFFFSCKKGDNPTSRLMQLAMNRIQPRFNILDCTYGIDRDKQNTVRSNIFHMGIQNCYTLQNSLMGYINSDGQIKQFTEEDLFHIGESVWKGIFVLDRPSDMIKKVLGFSKQQLLESSSLVLAKITQKQKDDNKKAILDDNASDSDPDGDILDLNERLQTCCKNNMNLKKKITEKIKKQKIKSKKGLLKGSLKKDEQKYGSNVQNLSLQVMLSSADAQNLVQKKQNLQKQLSLSEQKKNMNKLSLSNKRSTIYSKKRKQIKQSLKETKILSSENQIHKKNTIKNKTREVLTSTQIRFKNYQLKAQLLNSQQARKTSCSVIYQYPNQGIVNLKRKMSYKMKTQGTLRVQQQKQIPGVFYQDSQPKSQTKFTELKDESLKALLTDTFSVLKIKPKLSIKRYVKVNPYEKKKKQQQLISKVQQYQPLSKGRKLNLEPKKRTKTSNSAEVSTLSQRMQSNERQTQFRHTEYGTSPTKRNPTDFKYKRFQSFVYKGMMTQKSQKQNSSVFYYFPIL